MNKARQHVWLLATALFAIAITTLALPQMVLHPWNLVPAARRRWGKNIFTYLYHIVYGHGIWFYGMNYPYGEHIVYTDGQPLLSVPLSYIKNITVGQALTVMEWLIALVFILAIIYVFKILLHFGVKPLIALIFSGLIGICAPQIFRVTGNYSLAYSCIIPMLFLWTIRYSVYSKWKYPVFIFLLGCFFTFLHPYYSALILLWVLSYTAGCFIFKKTSVTEVVKHVYPMLISVLALFAVIGLVMKLTDPMTDRPIVPMGALSACTGFPDILTSNYSPLWQFVSAHIPGFSAADGTEGYSYPGMAIIIIALISLSRGLIFRVNRKKGKTIFYGGAYNPTWLFIGFATLLFSMGVPFIWHMEWLLDYASFLRQFRTLGRFSWIFYYIITIYGIVVFNKWYVSSIAKKKYFAAYTMLTAVIALWCLEGGGYFHYLGKRLGAAADNISVISPHSANNLPANLRALHYSPTDFQALLILDFFEVGSEKIVLGTDELTMTGVYTSMQTGLPLIDAMMSRTSWSVAEKQVKILAGPYVHKPILDDIKSNKPFLILQRDRDSLNADEKYLFTASDYIGHIQRCYAYACYPERLRENDKKNADYIKTLIPFIKPGADTCIKYAGDWYIDHFDNDHAKERFFGNGAIAHIKQPRTVIARIPVHPAGASRNYECSCWFLLGRDDCKSPAIELDQLDSAGNIIGITYTHASASTDNENLWFRSESYFSIPANCRVVKCTLIDNPAYSYKIMDELMLRPVDALIISKSANGSILVNNHLFKDVGYR